MAATQAAYGVVSLGERLAESQDGHGRVPLRTDLDVAATPEDTIVLAAGGPRDHAYRLTPAAPAMDTITRGESRYQS